MGIQNLSGEILGQYELREVLGVGGMGAVYRGYQTNLKRIVAIKVLPESFAEQPGYIDRFNREAMTAASMEHPHIVPVYDYGTQRNISYVVMRLLTGGSLSERLLQRNGTDLALPSLGETAALIKQLASALDYAHSQGIIHRDIKPGNVMFDNQGTAYLVDFGIAKLLGATSVLTGTGMTMGTPAYMSPEQWRAEDITPATDQYALGVMTYQLVTGHMPFEAPTPFSLMHKAINEAATPPHIYRPDTPLTIALVLERAMAKIPENRFPTITSFAQAFEGMVQGMEGGSTNIFTYQLRPKTSSFSTASKPAIQPPEPVKEPTVPPVVPAPVATPLHKNPLAWAGAIALILLGAAALIFATRGDSGAAVQQATAFQQTIVAIGVTQTVQAALLVAANSSPTSTASLTPTNQPSATSTVAPSDTTAPTTTNTAVPASATTAPSNTSLPSATNTAIPASDTPQPTSTVASSATSSAVPASATSAPSATPISATNTTVPPSATSRPSATTLPATAVPTVAAAILPATVAATLPPTEATTLAPGTVRKDKLGISQVWVPAGCFQMGSDLKTDVFAQTNEQPAHEVCLTHGFWIDQYEVTNAAYQPFITADGYSTRSYWPDDKGWNWVQDPAGGAKAPRFWEGFAAAQQPRIGISWYEANAYALWRGCQLPSEAQWEYAARGPKSLIYPWGNDYAQGKGNIGATRLKTVGSQPDDKSWIGAFDMGGSVWEWTADWYNKGYYATSVKDDPTGPTSGERHTIRGGTWNFGSEVARSASRNANYAPDYRDNNLGFRVVCSS